MFKKILLVTAAMSAVMCMSVAAHAELQAEYADGSVTLSGIETEAAQKTLLILTEDATNIDSSAKAYAEGGIIVQIDQDTAFATVPVGTLADGTYYVRVGGDADKIETTTFTVGSNSPYTDPTRLLGDIDGDTYILGNDVSLITNECVDSFLTGDSLQACDVNDDGNVLGNDMSALLTYVVDTTAYPEYNLGTKTLANKTNIVE